MRFVCATMSRSPKLLPVVLLRPGKVGLAGLLRLPAGDPCSPFMVVGMRNREKIKPQNVLMLNTGSTRSVALWRD
jgi:hypothetical protein